MIFDSKKNFFKYSFLLRRTLHLGIMDFINYFLSSTFSLLIGEKGIYVMLGN
jgi:hypothetical protein